MSRAKATRMAVHNIMDIDEPDTWPPEVRDRAQIWADELRDTTEYVGDLDLEKEDEDNFRRLLADRLLIAFHATRLLAHEVETIRQRGLRLASEKLVHDRVAGAYEVGAIDEELRDLLLTANVFHERDANNRADQVCLILSKRPFEHSPRGARPLMKEWGGELITMSAGGVALRPRLRGLGLPAIVVAAVDLSVSWRQHPTYPSLHKLFVGRVLGLEDLGADVFYRRPVLPDHIIDIWQPGHPEFDRYPELPPD